MFKVKAVRLGAAHHSAGFRGYFSLRLRAGAEVIGNIKSALSLKCANHKRFNSSLWSLAQ